MEGFLKDQSSEQPPFFFGDGISWERELFIPGYTKKLSHPLEGKNNVFEVRFVSWNKRFGFVYARVYLYF